MKGIEPIVFQESEHKMMTPRGLSIREPDSLSAGQIPVFKGFHDVEDEEGTMILLDVAKLKTTPSILLTTNQGTRR